jgi:hypothetical protein
MSIYYGSIPCQGIKANKQQCLNKAYYKQDDYYLCGVHSDKNKRQELPIDPDQKEKKDQLYKNHLKTLISQPSQGHVICTKMFMMKEVALIPSYLNVFPNNKHQNRKDGFGCSSLSPMRLGPVEHRQPGLPVCYNIENYHQYNKVYPNEIDDFKQIQLKGYLDKTPHRHKYDAKTMKDLRKQINNVNKNAPLYSIHQTLDGQDQKFTYVESRYFYCCAYEKLAKETEDYKKLKQYIDNGINLNICGYDAYPITKDLLEHYEDPVKAFGHELVLYCLLTIHHSSDYPWHLYRLKYPEIYNNIAHVI